MSKNIRAGIFAGSFLYPLTTFTQVTINTSSCCSFFEYGEFDFCGLLCSTTEQDTSVPGYSDLKIKLLDSYFYTSFNSPGFIFISEISGEFPELNDDLNNSSRSDISFYSLTDCSHHSNYFNTIPNPDCRDTKTYWELTFESGENIESGRKHHYYFVGENQISELFFPDSGGFSKNQPSANLQISDFRLGFGTQFTIPLNCKRELICGVVYTINHLYCARYMGFAQKNNSPGIIIHQNTPGYVKVEGETFEILYLCGEENFLLKQDLLPVFACFYHGDWGNAKITGEKSKFLTDLNKFAVVAGWGPDIFSIRNYYSSIAYRAGFNKGQG